MWLQARFGGKVIGDDRPGDSEYGKNCLILGNNAPEISLNYFFVH